MTKNMINLRDISYLKNGTFRQREAFDTIHALDIFTKLKSFRPTLVSTVCIDIDIENSDLDIICEYNEPNVFEKVIRSNYEIYPYFKFWYRNKEMSEAVASFDFNSFKIEIFGSTMPIEQQNAYRHLLIMHRLLILGGNILRKKVRNLKCAGYKSESAFAKILGLTDNPYKALLNLESYSDTELQEIINQYHNLSD